MVRNLAAADIVFTVAEVAKLLKVSKAKVYTMVERGELEHFRMGTVLRVRREALEALIRKAQR